MLLSLIKASFEHCKIKGKHMIKYGNKNLYLHLTVTKCNIFSNDYGIFLIISS